MSLDEVLSFLYRDGTFPRIVDIAVRGIKDGRTFIWVRPSGHTYVSGFCSGLEHPSRYGSIQKHRPDATRIYMAALKALVYSGPERGRRKLVAAQYQWERSSVLDNIYSAGFGHIIASHLTARTVIVFFSGKCPEISTIFALKHAHLPPIMNIGTKFPGKAAPHLFGSTRWHRAGCHSIWGLPTISNCC